MSDFNDATWSGNAADSLPGGSSNLNDLSVSRVVEGLSITADAESRPAGYGSDVLALLYGPWGDQVITAQRLAGGDSVFCRLPDHLCLVRDNA